MGGLLSHEEEMALVVATGAVGPNAPVPAATAAVPGNAGLSLFLWHATPVGNFCLDMVCNIDIACTWLLHVLQLESQVFHFEDSMRITLTRWR